MERKYIYKITEVSNYDGDSFDLTLDLGFDLVVYKKTRIFGIDTPELRGGTNITKSAASLAKEEAATWVNNAMQNGGAYFLSEGYAGKFGRPLGDITDKEGNSLREFLLDSKLGVPYEGQSKASIQEQHDQNITWLVEQGRI